MCCIDIALNPCNGWSEKCARKQLPLLQRFNDNVKLLKTAVIKRDHDIIQNKIFRDKRCSKAYACTT